METKTEGSSALSSEKPVRRATTSTVVAYVVRQTWVRACLPATVSVCPQANRFWEHGVPGLPVGSRNVSWGPFKEKKGEDLSAELSRVAATLVVLCRGCYGSGGSSSRRLLHCD